MQDICFILLPDISNALGYTQSSSKNHNATTHQTHFIELETPTKFTQLYKNGTEYKEEKFFGKKSVPYYFVSRPDVTEVRLKVCCLDDSCLTDCVILGHHGAGGVEVGRDLHVGRPGVVQLSFEVVNPPEENPAENC